MKREKAHILYVDDEPDNLMVFRSTFRRDFKVHTAESAKEGLELLNTLGRDVEIIITDQRMPEMTGVEFLEQIITQWPESIRMILTGFSDMEAIVEAINKGRIYRYITKPWDKDELIVTFNNAIESYKLKRENRGLIENLQNVNNQLARSNEVLEEKVKKRTAEIAKKNKDMMDSINYAKRIQEAILPTNQSIKEAFKDFFIFFKPRNIVSGDFYFFTKKKDKYFIAAVDCTGHGVPGAFMSMIGSETLNNIINQQNIEQADKILQNLHESITHALKQDKTRNKDGMDLALCIIDTQKDTLEFAGAKNPLVYIQNNKLHKIKGAKMSIGGVKKGYESPFVTHTIDISKPTTCYIFSDGFQDQFGGTENRKYMGKRMRNLLFQIHTKAMNEQKQIIEQELAEWMSHGDKQIDDILIIGFRL